MIAGTFASVESVRRYPSTLMAKAMKPKNLNSTRAGRAILNLDDRKISTTNGGEKDNDGNAMPRYEDEILEQKATAALERAQPGELPTATSTSRRTKTTQKTKTGSHVR
jgi:hypothetical protein